MRKANNLTNTGKTMADIKLKKNIYNLLKKYRHENGYMEFFSKYNIDMTKYIVR